jgi:hypothetical protein
MSLVGINFGALAHDNQIHLSGNFRQALAGPGRSDIGVEIELHAKGRRNVYPTLITGWVIEMGYRPENDACRLHGLVQNPVGQGRSRLLKGHKPNLGEIELQAEGETAVHRIKNRYRRFGDLPTDSITG